MSRRQVELKTVPQMQTMHRAGLVLHRALDAAVAAAVPGTTTAAVDAVFAAVLEEAGATPNFLGYYGYPKTICASVNEEVVHGIPGERVRQPVGALGRAAPGRDLGVVHARRRRGGPRPARRGARPPRRVERIRTLSGRLPAGVVPRP